MTDREYDDLMAAYRKRFGHGAPYNMDDPVEFAQRVQEALDKDKPMRDAADDLPEGVLI
jgi:hypothetical protein